MSWAASSWTRSTTPSPPSTRELSACRPARGRRRHHGRHACRGDLGEDGDGPFLRRPRERRGRHPQPCADGGRPDPAAAAPPTRPTPGPAPIMIPSSAWRRPSRCSASPRKMPGGRLTPAAGPATLCGVFVETDDRTGLAGRSRRSGSAAGLRPAVAALTLDLGPRLERSEPGYLSRAASPGRDAHGRPFPVQEHHVPEGQAGRPALQAVLQAVARNHRRGQARACPIPPTTRACALRSPPPRRRACPRT